jgi:rhamnosyltransferase
MSKIPMHTEVTAIVVTYNPNMSALKALCERLTTQAGHVIIVDNHSQSTLQSFVEQWSNVELIESSENLGIAWAHNVGINWATLHGAKYIILFDQDSLPGKSMIARLVGEYVRLTEQGEHVAAIGPSYHNTININSDPFVVLDGFKLVKKSAQGKVSIKVLFVISSGCLIPLSAIKEVGLMREDFFIDYVDVEWCLRAKSKGFDCYGATTANMTHSIGQQARYFMGRNYSLHDSYRYYYLFRNAVLLYKGNYIKKQFKIADGFKLLMKFLIYPIIHPKGLTCLKMSVIGLWHGVKNKTGRL